MTLLCPGMARLEKQKSSGWGKTVTWLDWAVSRQIAGICRNDTGSVADGQAGQAKEQKQRSGCTSMDQEWGTLKRESERFAVRSATSTPLRMTVSDLGKCDSDREFVFTCPLSYCHTILSYHPPVGRPRGDWRTNRRGRRHREKDEDTTPLFSGTVCLEKQLH